MLCVVVDSITISRTISSFNSSVLTNMYTAGSISKTMRRGCTLGNPIKGDSRLSFSRSSEGRLKSTLLSHGCCPEMVNSSKYRRFIGIRCVALRRGPNIGKCKTRLRSWVNDDNSARWDNSKSKPISRWRMDVRDTARLVSGKCSSSFIVSTDGKLETSKNDARLIF